MVAPESPTTDPSTRNHMQQKIDHYDDQLLRKAMNLILHSIVSAISNVHSPNESLRLVASKLLNMRGQYLGIEQQKSPIATRHHGRLYCIDHNVKVSRSCLNVTMGIPEYRSRPKYILIIIRCQCKIQRTMQAKHKKAKGKKKKKKKKRERERGEKQCIQDIIILSSVYNNSRTAASSSSSRRRK